VLACTDALKEHREPQTVQESLMTSIDGHPAVRQSKTILARFCEAGIRQKLATESCRTLISSGERSLKMFGATGRHKGRTHVTSAEMIATGALTGSDFSPTLASL
jgi:hypothetical protein